MRAGATMISLDLPDSLRLGGVVQQRKPYTKPRVKWNFFRARRG